MFKFRNVSGVELSVYKPEGEPGSRVVAVDAVIEVDGAAVGELEDSYVVAQKKPVGNEDGSVDYGGNARAWAKALWQLVEDKGAVKATPVKEN